MIKVSVIIPTKNRKVLLERCLKSLSNQTVKPDEIIVVNDGSNDNTKNWLEKMKNDISNLKIINREISGGVNVARHEGIKSSDSEWVACLDDDDEFLPDAIEKIKKRSEEVPDKCGVIFFNTIVNNNKGSFRGGFQFEEKQEFCDLGYDDMMLIRSKIKGDCKPVIRRRLFVKDGYKFPESVNGSESYFFYLIARDGKGIRCYPEVTTLIHQEIEVGDRLSLSASIKNPWPLFVLHFKQIFQHYRFYLRHPKMLFQKKVAMLKLLAHVFLNFFKNIYRRVRRLFGLQRWVRLGIRYRVSLPKGYENVDFTVPFLGYKYSGNLNDYIDKYVFYFGTYEREELLYLKKFISKDSVVLDIGANIGHHSLFFSRFAKKVYSFEPYDKLFYKLSHRMEQNKVKNVEAYNFGLGKENRESEFFASSGGNEGVGSFIASPEKVAVGKLVIKNGDEFVESVKEKIGFIKIDVEGMETEVLSGLKKTILKDKPVMFVEMTPEAQTEIDKDVSSLYDIYIVDANNPFLFFFNKLTCRLEKFEPKNRIENLLFIPKV